MFPTTFMPVAPEIENRHFYNIFHISENPDNGGVSDPTSATVFYGYEVDSNVATLGLKPSWAELDAVATTTETRFAIGENFSGRNLVWDKDNVFIAFGKNATTLAPLVYRSADRGVTWTNITSAVVAGGMSGTAGVGGIHNDAVSYVHPGVFLIAVEAGVGQRKLIRSLDKGITWEDITSESDIGLFFPSLSGFKIQHVAGNYVIAGSIQWQNLIISYDAGITWSYLTVPTIFNGRVAAIPGVISNYNGKWQYKDDGSSTSKLIYESSTLTTDPNSWVIRGSNMTSPLNTSNIKETFVFAKVPNTNEGFYELGSVFNQVWRVQSSTYDVDGNWTVFNAFGASLPKASFQFVGPNSVKSSFTTLSSGLHPQRRFAWRVRHGNATSITADIGPGDYLTTMTSTWNLANTAGQQYLGRRGRVTGNFSGIYYY